MSLYFHRLLIWHWNYFLIFGSNNVLYTKIMAEGEVNPHNHGVLLETSLSLSQSSPGTADSLQCTHNTKNDHISAPSSYANKE